MINITINSYDCLRNEIDMLKGNINRMCVTDDVDELQRMFEFANARITAIFKFNTKKFNLQNDY